MADLSAPYRDIIALLQNFEVAGTKPFNYVAIFNNQPVQWEEGKVESWQFPQALVEAVDPIEWLEIGGNIKAADVVWRIHVAMEQLDAGDGSMEQNFDIFTLRKYAIWALARQKPTACNMLFQIADRQDKSHTNIYVWEIDFKCHVIDSTSSQYDTANPGAYVPYTPDPAPLPLEIDISFANPLVNNEAGIDGNDN